MHIYKIYIYIWDSKYSVQYVQHAQCLEHTHYAHYSQHNLRYIAHISLLLSNQSQISDMTERITSVPSAGRSTDCVDIASGSELHVAKWTRYVHVVSGSVQAERPAVSVHYVKLYYLYGSPCNIGVTKFVSSRGTPSFSRSTMLHAVRYTTLSVITSFMSILLPFAT